MFIEGTMACMWLSGKGSNEQHMYLMLDFPLALENSHVWYSALEVVVEKRQI